MATFSDLVTLLMTFFVLLLTMSSMDAKKLKETFGFFSGTIGYLDSAQGTDVSSSTLVKPPSVMPNTFDALLGTDPFPPAARNEETIEDLLRAAASEAMSSEFVEVERTRDGLVLRIAGSVAYDVETLRLQPAAEQLLLDIADLSVSSGLALDVATNVAPAERRKESAWHRAVVLGDRAASLVERQGRVPPDRLRLETYGTTAQRKVNGQGTTLTVALVNPDKGTNKEKGNGGRDD